MILDAHRDARVAPLTAEEARSLFEVREQLDPLAVRLAAERGTRRTAPASEQRPPRAKPLDAGSGLDALAHRLSTRRSTGRRCNDLLISLLDGLWDKADRYRRATLETREDSPPTGPAFRRNTRP